MWLPYARLFIGWRFGWRNGFSRSKRWLVGRHFICLLSVVLLFVEHILSIPKVGGGFRRRVSKRRRFVCSLCVCSFRFFGMLT